MKNFLQKGTSITVPAPKALKSGDTFAVGVLAGIAGVDAANGQPVEMHLEGCYRVSKISAQAWTVGQAIHLTPASGLCTNVAAAGTVYLGVAIEAAANPSGFGNIRLNGAAPAAVGT